MKKLLSVTGFTAVLTTLKMLTGFIVVKMIAIYAGPSGLAMLGQLQSTVTALNGIVSSPLGPGMVRYTSENYTKGYAECAPWWSASVRWSLLLMLTVVPIGIYFSKEASHFLFNSTNYFFIIISLCVSLPFSALNTTIISVVNGMQDYKRYLVLNALSTMITTLIMVFLVYKFGVSGALFAVSVNMAVAGGVLLMLCHNQPWVRFRYWFTSVDTVHLKKIGSYVLMALTTALTVPISLLLVRSVIIEQLGWEQAGYWQAMWRMSEVYLSIITLSLSTYYLPRLSSLVTFDEIKKEITETAKIVIPIVTILAFIIYLFRDVIILILFTEDFKSVSGLFAIQLLGDVIKVSALLYAYPMLSKGAAKWYIFSEVFFAASFFILTYILIGYFNIKGVAIAYFVNYMLYFVFVRINFKSFAA